MNYTLKCNEAQLRVINIALEEYFRLRLGQMGDLAEDLAMLQYQTLSTNVLTRSYIHGTTSGFVWMRPIVWL
jgi:hypothetical protein